MGYKKNLRIATIRTAVPTSWAAGVVIVAKKLGIDLSATDAALAVSGLTVVVHRLGYVLSAAKSRVIARVGIVLLGSSDDPPEYDTEELEEVTRGDGYADGYMDGHSDGKSVENANQP